MVPLQSNELDYWTQSGLDPSQWGRSSYNVTPQSTQGTGIYGRVPGVTALPNPYADLSNVYPNLGQSQSNASNAVLAQMRGELSPATIAAIQDDAARFGVKSGMPGSGLAGNRGLRNLGLNTEAQINQGLKNYGNLVQTTSGTMTVRPETQIALSQANAQLLAAPDPGQAGRYAENLFRNYMQSMAQRSASPAGGTGAYAGRGTAPISTPTTDPYAKAPFIPTGPPNAYENENLMSGYVNANPATSLDFQSYMAGKPPGVGRSDYDYYDYWMQMPDEQAWNYVNPVGSYSQNLPETYFGPYPEGYNQTMPYTPDYSTGRSDYEVPLDYTPSWDNYESLFEY